MDQKRGKQKSSQLITLLIYSKSSRNSPQTIKTYIMNQLVDKRVRINLYPFKQSAHLFSLFRLSAIKQGWTDDETALVANQINGLSLDERFEILNGYCHTYAEDMQSFTNEDVRYMLAFLGENIHYLGTRDIKFWDEYDWSNFNSLKRKATCSIKRVYGLYTESVPEELKYEVTTPPKKFYETLEEALEAVPAGQESTTNIYALWKDSKD